MSRERREYHPEYMYLPSSSCVLPLASCLLALLSLAYYSCQSREHRGNADMQLRIVYGSYVSFILEISPSDLV